MPERLVVAVDGSTHLCSAALLRYCRVGEAAGRKAVVEPAGRWEVVARRTGVEGRGQAQELLGLIEDMFVVTGCGRAQIGAVVVGTGPGTFTGVRIAVATARALGLALSIPVLGVSTLSALAAGAAAALDERGPLADVVGPSASAEGPAAVEGRGTHDPGRRPADGRERSPRSPARLVPVVDARRGQVFFTIYERTGDSEGACGSLWVRSAEYGVYDGATFGEMLAAEVGELTVVGAGMSLVGALPRGATSLPTEVEAERLVVGQDLLEERGGLPQGSRLGPWLAARLTGSERDGVSEWVAKVTEESLLAVGAPESVKPIYVRAPDADIHITKMKDPWGGTLDRR